MAEKKTTDEPETTEVEQAPKTPGYNHATGEFTP